MKIREFTPHAEHQSIGIELTDPSLLKHFQGIEGLECEVLSQNQFFLKRKSGGPDIISFCEKLTKELLNSDIISKEQAAAFAFDLESAIAITAVQSAKVQEQADLKVVHEIISALPLVDVPGSIPLRLKISILDPEHDEHLTPGTLITNFDLLPKGYKEITLIDSGSWFPEERQPDDYKYSFIRTVDDNDQVSYHQFSSRQQLNALLSIIDRSPELATIEAATANLDVAYDWSSGLDPIYLIPGRGVTSFYNSEQKLLINEVETFARINPDISKIRVIELGCGQALALRGSGDAIAKVRGIENVICLGGDYCKINVSEAKRLWPEEKESVKHDIVLLDSTSRECEDLLKKKVEGFEDLVICSGHITRIVLNNVFEAQKALNNIHRANVKYILSSGLREELYTKAMLEQMGFTGVINRRRNLEGINLIERAAIYPPLQKFIDASEFHDVKYLNMSMCPDPIKAVSDLKDTAQLSKVEYLNLSHCDLTRYRPDELRKFFAEFSNLKEVIYIASSQEEIDFINSIRDRFPDIFPNVNPLLCKEERLAVLPFDMFHMLDRKWMLDTIQKDNPTIRSIPDFLCRSDFFNLKGPAYPPPITQSVFAEYAESRATSSHTHRMFRSSKHKEEPTLRQDETSAAAPKSTTTGPTPNSVSQVTDFEDKKAKTPESATPNLIDPKKPR